MDTAQIKAYAPKARKDFINAVTQRAARFGIHGDDNFDLIEFKGDTAIIGSQVFTKKGGELREKLLAKVKQTGFEMFIRSSAYTWFNRFVAIRYMELHDFLDHGFRVLSNPNGSDNPEILEHATEVDLPGLDREKVLELRLAGDKDNELYRMLIIAQCNALHKAMPFLFDRIDNEAELLLPDNLLHTNSPVKRMVSQIDETLWDDVEIIGWIYQFYISEKKDEVIGKVVKSEDIPAATQLFTPNWIVKYMVQNTLGRMWMATYPESSLKSKMEYYIEPAEQEPEVQAEIDAATPKELNPEELTFLDPACGSGHILVEAYDIFKEIYLERGYRTRDIPRLILSKNIYGLDIDDRAAQLACFAVLMRAREDDRRLFSRDDLALNIMSIVETKGIDKDKLLDAVSKRDGNKGIWVWINQLVESFKSAKTYGSLITIPKELVKKLNEIISVVESSLGANNTLFNYAAELELERLKPIIKQAQLLAQKYDCVVANPPYMGNKGMNPTLKGFLKVCFPPSKTDLMTCFMERSMSLTGQGKYWSMINIPSWMFLNSFEKLRDKLLSETTFCTLLHLGRGIFGSDFGTVAFTIQNKEPHKKSIGLYRRLFNEHVQVRPIEKIRQLFFQKRYGLNYFPQSNFKKVPGNPISYWISKALINIFDVNLKVADVLDAAQGMKTLDNDLFIREWPEVSIKKNSIFNSGNSCKWFPINHGGEYRKWYGNNESLLNWKNDGHDIKSLAKKKYNSVTRTVTGMRHYFNEGISWTAITSSRFSIRRFPKDYLFTNAGMCAFGDSFELDKICCFLNTKVAESILKFLSPTLNYGPNQIKLMPVVDSEEIHRFVKHNFSQIMTIAKTDWDSYERSWDFKISPLITYDNNELRIKDSYERYQMLSNDLTTQMQLLEQMNNKIFINAYGLEKELESDVSLSDISLTCNPIYRYGNNKSKEECDILLCTDTIKELISYVIGCIMGRYSLDNSGLIYAHSDNIDFDPLKYKTFSADDDGIIPIMDMDWFEDDATKRFIEFIKTAWPEEHLDENLKFVADSLNPKTNESPENTIRRYLSTTFFKDHMKMYKKRPIYWLFSSGKQKAFECLVYLHRYNESTLSRMRSNYVTPLQGNISARIEFLDHEKNAATTASAQKKIQKQIDVLKKKQVELKSFDDELRHYADMKISLDLDDGVKVNYGKFGNLLAEKKAITGKA